MKIETPPVLKGKTTEWSDLEKWLRQLILKLKSKNLSLEPLPVLTGGSDGREWNSLTKWLKILHSQLSQPFSQKIPVVTKTTTVTLRPEEMGLVLVTSAAPYTITLPPAGKMGIGGWYKFLKTDATANAVTLDGSGSETINGSASINYLDAQYEFFTVTTDGSNWFITDKSWLS